MQNIHQVHFRNCFLYVRLCSLDFNIYAVTENNDILVMSLISLCFIMIWPLYRNRSHTSTTLSDNWIVWRWLPVLGSKTKILPLSFPSETSITFWLGRNSKLRGNICLPLTCPSTLQTTVSVSQEVAWMVCLPFILI